MTKPGTVGELISKAHDLRKEHPPVRLSDQPVPLTPKEFIEMTAGPIIAVLIVIVMTILVMIGTKDVRHHNAEIRERRENTMQYYRKLEQRRDVQERRVVKLLQSKTD